MEKYINLSIGSTPIKLPNSWETIAPADFLTIVEALADLYGGSITPNEVLCRYTCSALGLDMAKIVNKHHAPDLLAIAQRVTFIFTTEATSVAGGVGVSPAQSPSAPELEASASSAPAPTLAPNLTFARQFLPTLASRAAYTIGTQCDRLTCSLTALQYIEAIDALRAGEQQLSLLAAILYAPHPYDTTQALDLVPLMSRQSPLHLLAVKVIFQALVNFLYTRTHFSLLAQFKPKKESPIATTMADTLYDLATEGYGTVEQVEQMNVITFLSIMRKKTIDTVRSMRSMEISTPDIAARTGLPLPVINDIVH